MSYIQETYRCKNCKFEFNVALGTFGSGMPTKCPQCGYLPHQFEHVSAGWVANNIHETEK